MFESVGRVRDEEQTRRRMAALALTASAAAFVAVLSQLVPDPPSPPELLPIDDWEVALIEPDAPLIEDRSPVFQAPAAGGGDAEPEPEAHPYIVRPLNPVVATTVATERDPGDGKEHGPGVGPKGPGIGATACPEGARCEGLGSGPLEIGHSELEILDRADPRFPEAARRAGYTDERCDAAVSIGRDGRVYDVKVSRCPVVFHREVERALSRWRFAPVTTDAGAPVEARTRIRVRFRGGSR